MKESQFNKGGKTLLQTRRLTERKEIPAPGDVEKLTKQIAFTQEFCTTVAYRNIYLCFWRQNFEEPGMEAAWVKPVIWQKLLDYKPSQVFFILGGNDITSTSNPMEIYRCIWRRIDLVQALHPRAFAFAFGILPCTNF